MTGIYKIENKLNHKCYIGQALDIELRFKQHRDGLMSSAKSWYPEARKESRNINDTGLSIKNGTKDALHELIERGFMEQIGEIYILKI